jgi:hypothetical protein
MEREATPVGAKQAPAGAANDGRFAALFLSLPRRNRMFRFLYRNLWKAIAPLLAAVSALAAVGDAGAIHQQGVRPRPPAKQVRPQGTIWLQFIGVTAAQGVHGVLLQDVQPGKWADQNGLRPGNVIVSCDGTPVFTPDDLNTALSNGVINAQDTWTLEYRDTDDDISPMFRKVFKRRR